MESEIFTKTKYTKLSKVNGNYQFNCEGSDTGLLYFRIDWSDHVWESRRVKIKVGLKDPTDFIFLAIEGNEDINYENDQILCESIYSAKYKFVPFILKKLVDPAEVVTRFVVTITNMNDQFLASVNLRLDLI